MKQKLDRFVVFISLAVLLLPETVFAGSLTPAERALLNGADNVIQNLVPVDMESIPLSKEQLRAADSFNKGLASVLREKTNPDTITPESLASTDRLGIGVNGSSSFAGLPGEENGFERIISAYCKEHCDAVSSEIHKMKGHAAVLALNTETPRYKELVQHYKINDKMDITIAPDAIYVDEFAETERAGTVQNPAAAKTDWVYKKCAARRTYLQKTTVNGQTNAWKIGSVHTGGEIKYNRAKALYASGYYGCSQPGRSIVPVTFKEIVKQSEACSGSSWHYKYYGHVGASDNMEGAAINLKDKPLGCEVIVNQNGAVTKHYWPNL